MKKFIIITIICILYFCLGYGVCLYIPAQIDGGYLREDGWLFVRLKTPEFIPKKVFRTTRIDDYWISKDAEAYIDDVCYKRMLVDGPQEACLCAAVSFDGRSYTVAEEDLVVEVSILGKTQ